MWTEWGKNHIGYSTEPRNFAKPVQNKGAAVQVVWESCFCYVVHLFDKIFACTMHCLISIIDSTAYTHIHTQKRTISSFPPQHPSTLFLFLFIYFYFSSCTAASAFKRIIADQTSKDAVLHNFSIDCSKLGGSCKPLEDIALTFCFGTLTDAGPSLAIVFQRIQVIHHN